MEESRATCSCIIMQVSSTPILALTSAKTLFARNFMLVQFMSNQSKEFKS